MRLCQRKPLDVLGRHVFRLKQVDFDGAFADSPEVEATVELADAYQLSAAYPNPFNPEASFTLAVREGQAVRVEVFDALGRRVALLHDGLLEAGRSHRFVLDGGPLPSGLYLVRTVGETFAWTQRVVLAK